MLIVEGSDAVGCHVTVRLHLTSRTAGPLFMCRLSASQPNHARRPAVPLAFGAKWATWQQSITDSKRRPVIEDLFATSRTQHSLLLVHASNP